MEQRVSPYNLLLFPFRAFPSVNSVLTDPTRNHSWSTCAAHPST